MTGHPWERPYDPTAPIAEQLRRLDEPEPLPHMTAPYRVEAPAFSEEYRDQIGAAARAITTWIDEQVEAGATDHLVEALRTKGYAVTPPPNDPPAMLSNRDRPEKQAVTVAYIRRQKAKGWPDIHPEDYCHRCGNRNISWWINSHIWNAVMESAFAPYDGIVCPSCFGELFEACYPATSWELRLSEDTRGARAFREAEGRTVQILVPDDGVTG
ncbi:hypothetical protein QC999_gp15 [Microbacterium phage Cressida]|uniref:Uncharacterized protein n=1 Tax=Microbacterium phage Cressida TaxID=2591216 RepID=A0A514DIB4_9CAUD|nr:hypothetical protein QC999_gp15 [Microbacterium phage Cressida]QDH93335.1 hypothetical protein PBI_CRESSIDA_93 [Microbacterium phage Cressida]